MFKFILIVALVWYFKSDIHLTTSDWIYVGTVTAIVLALFLWWGTAINARADREQKLIDERQIVPSLASEDDDDDDVSKAESEWDLFDPNDTRNSEDGEPGKDWI